MRYILGIILTLIAILIQVSWGGYIMVVGFTLPIVFFTLVIMRSLFEIEYLIWYAFIAGLLVDILQFYIFGSNALGLMFGISIYHMVHERFINRPVLARIVGFSLGILVFYSILWILANTLPTT